MKSPFAPKCSLSAPCTLAAGLALLCAVSVAAADAVFHRAINLNGPALEIDGHAWEGGASAPHFVASGKTFENQKVALKPPTDAERTRMIRSSVWGSEVELVMSGVPAGPLQIFLYVWEDNISEQFDILVNGRVVQAKFHSGAAGAWKRLGPWLTEAAGGKLTVSARAASHGAANFSGLEVWAGSGVVPAAGASLFADAPSAEQTAFFESKIRPVLAEHCYECHSAQAEKLKGGLLLDSRAGVRKGGDTGPALTPGDPEASLIIQALRHASEDVAMPPKKMLPAEVIADFEQWVRLGAPDPRTADTVAALQEKNDIDWDAARQWWSFRSLNAPPPPAVKNKSWAANDIDRFILAKLEAANLKPAADAEPRALIRRMSFDLTGLPPTPEEVEAFVADSLRHPQSAIANLVDRLLASPRYGERWGRHWLDVVRYADTAGDNSDYPIPQIHRYRDWVIAAFNNDLPYDEFIRDQLAGDLRGGATDAQRQERLIATGYIANARRFGSRVDDYPQHLTIEDTLDNLGRSFLGLTVSCARCHDHKFDPVTTQDYYALYGIFHSTRYPWPGIELDKKQRDLVPLVPASEFARADAARIARLQEQKRLDREASRLKEAEKNAPADQKEKLKKQLEAAEKAKVEHAKKSAAFELAYAVAEAAEKGDVPVQQKGDPARPGETVPRRFLTVFGGDSLPPGDDSSGRAQLAEWIIDRGNPLAARVMANRIWLHHFGRGIVPTPNDFGKQGKPPSHPELLDHLAAALRDGGWSVKSLHRHILLSRTYRMSSARDEESLARDPANELLSAFPRRRLDAESIRDTLLLLGGDLNLAPAGPHPFPPQHEWGFTQHKPFKEVYDSNHRSVYLMTQRIQRHPYLAIFDGADPSTSTPARTTSTTPLQALYLLNDSLVHRQAGKLAARLVASGSDDKARIQHAYELLFARPATRVELASALKFLEQSHTLLASDGTPVEKVESESWHALVRVLVRLNEFVYVE